MINEVGVGFDELLDIFEVFGSKLKREVGIARLLVFAGMGDREAHVAAVSAELKNVGDIGIGGLSEDPIEVGFGLEDFIDFIE